MCARGGVVPLLCTKNYCLLCSIPALLLFFLLLTMLTIVLVAPPVSRLLVDRHRDTKMQGTAHKTVEREGGGEGGEGDKQVHTEGRYTDTELERQSYRQRG